MLGDSVVEVKHLQPNRNPTAKRSTYMLFGIGALFLLMSLVAFSKGVSTAATNKKDLTNWTQVKKKSVRSFNGTNLSIGWDYMAFGGLAFGIFAMGWGMMRLRRTVAPSAFNIDGEANPLVAERSGEMVVNLPSTMDAELRTSAGITAKSELASSFIVPQQGSLRVANGPASFLIRAVPAPRTMPNLVARFDSRVATFLGASALAHGLLLLIMNTVQPDPRAVATDLGTQDVRLTISESNPADTDPPTPDTDDGNDSDLKDPAGSNGKPGDAGKAGDPENNDKPGSTKVQGSASEVKVSKASALEDARNAGILDVVKSAKVFSHIDGDAWLTSGMDDANSYGPGTEPGDGGGNFGHSHHGFGPGGDGENGVIRSGRYKTNGPTGPGNSKVPGGGRGPGLDHKAGVPDPKPLNPTTDGELDRSIIRRYIQRKIRTIRNCYERELLARPELRGTLTARFIITGTGSVIGSSASGMNSSGLHSCVASVMSTIKFPKTEDGGIVKVKYPFRFNNR